MKFAALTALTTLAAAGDAGGACEALTTPAACLSAANAATHDKLTGDLKTSRDKLEKDYVNGVKSTRATMLKAYTKDLATYKTAEGDKETPWTSCSGTAKGLAKTALEKDITDHVSAGAYKEASLTAIKITGACQTDLLAYVDAQATHAS